MEEASPYCAQASISSKSCPICWFSFDSIEFLLRHLQDMKDDKFHRTTTAECLFCSEKLSGNALLIHLQVEHPTHVLGSDINQSHNLDKTV